MGLAEISALTVLAVLVISLIAGGISGVWHFYVKKQLAVPEDPRRILDTRFAKGEIDEAEYTRRLTVLQLGPPLDLFDHAIAPPPRERSDAE